MRPHWTCPWCGGQEEFRHEHVRAIRSDSGLDPVVTVEVTYNVRHEHQQPRWLDLEDGDEP